jgi:hypothetical protein
MYPNDGKKPLIEVNRANNGWIVKVHHVNRDHEVSPETKEKRIQEAKQRQGNYVESEKRRISKDLMTQLASMAVIGEVAGKAQAQAIDGELEAWKQPKGKKLSTEDIFKKIEPMVAKIADKTIEQRGSDSFGLGNINEYVSPIMFQSVEEYVFSEREEMVKFVTEMLQPIVE